MSYFDTINLAWAKALVYAINIRVVFMNSGRQVDYRETRLGPATGMYSLKKPQSDVVEGHKYISHGS